MRFSEKDNRYDRAMDSIIDDAPAVLEEINPHKENLYDKEEKDE